MNRTLFLVATAVLLISLGFRTLGITEVPPGLSGDESINGSDALNVWRWGTTPVFFTNNYGREAGFIYMMALSMKLFGANVLAIRLPAIVCGTSAILLSFVLLKRLWNLHVAALTTLLMGISFWPVFVGRIGLRAVSMLPLQSLAAYSLWRALQSGTFRSSWKWWLTLGASLGLVTYTYIPGRIFPAVIAGWIISMWSLTPREKRPPIKRHLPALALTIVVALVIFAPFGYFMIQHPDQANQRVNELADVLESLKAGDLRPLLKTTVQTLGMFTFVGDEYWRYNIEDRPVFDWTTGVLFYLGLVRCLVGIRHPRNQLLLIWLAVMLAPSIFAPGSPSFLRSTGAIFPIYTMPALAFDAIVGTCRTRLKANQLRIAQQGLTALATAGLLAIAVKDGIAYFVTWPNTPRVREVYTAGLAQVGRQLNELETADSESAVLIGCDFASDYARDMIRFQTQYAGPIRWFTGRDAMVFPATSSTPADAYFLLADAMPPNALISPITEEAETLYVAEASNGDFESAAYKLPAAVWGNAPWQPENQLRGRFQNAMTLIGYTAPAQAQRGESATFLVVWEVPEAFEVDRTEALWFHLELKDESGNRWDTRGNLLPYPTWEWHPGDVVAQQLTVPIAADMPPGDVTLHFAIEKAQTPLPFSTPGQPTATDVPMGPVEVLGIPKAESPKDAQLLGQNQEVSLVQALIIGVAMPGDTIHATFTWYAESTPSTDYAIRVAIREPDCAGTPVYTEILPLWEDRYPTSQWQPEETIRSFHHPTLPRDLAIGTYGLTIDLVQADTASNDITPPETTTQACYPLEITGHQREFDVPPMDNRIDQPLPDGISLLGYTLSPSPQSVKAGDTLDIALIWQAWTEPSQSYTVFTHLYGPDASLVAQHDSNPCDGSCPTSSWVAEEVITDQHQLAIPADAAPGTYTIGVGMYDSRSMQRLEIPESDNNVISLLQVTLE